MAKSPNWLAQLRVAPEAQTGIRWFTDKQIAKARDEFDEETDGHLKLYGTIASYTDENLEGDAAERLARCVKVGEGVEGGRFSVASGGFAGAGLNYQAEFWFDPDAPDTLFYSLNWNCPPHLWIPVGKTRDSITSALAVYYPDIPADPVESAAEYAARLRHLPITRNVPADWPTTRVMLGVVGEMREIENTLIFRNAFCRTFDSMATALGNNERVPRTAFHTLNSFSRVSLEYHSWLQYDDGEGGTASPVVAEITYPPCPHADLIRVYNAAMDTDVPEGVPVDVLAALFGYPIKGLPRLHRAIGMNSQPEGITYVLGLVVATEGDDATLVARLRELAVHPSPRVRARVATHAHVREHDELVSEMLSREQDAGVREHLENILGPLAEEE